MISRALCSLLAATLLLACVPALALASKTQESTFQDDPRLVYGPMAKVDATLDTLRDLGVERIRVSVFWNIVAPAADQLQKPAFDATDPAQYPAANWVRYDRLVRAAQARGIRVNFNVTSPVPRWATTASPRADLQKNFGPNAEEFGRFVRALGTRYSGGYAGLPRVDYWSIWNEPNQAGWLTPQWSPDPRNAKKQVDAAPALYRGLVASAWQALADTGHGADTILVGETAPQGAEDKQGLSQSIDALKFIRRLYCLDDNLNALKGAEAQVRGCPADLATFVADNPALFKATGYAHHPYALLTPPDRVSKPPDWASMGDLRALSRELAHIYQRYRQKVPSGGVPLYLTEYGYQTKPDPVAGRLVTFGLQAAWLNQAEYIAYKSPSVRAVNQFLLYDDAPTPGVDRKKHPDLAWRTFQSGLQSLAGTKKPAFQAYVTPIFLHPAKVRRGSSVGVFGLLRPARAGATVQAQLQFRARGARAWQRRKTVTVRGARHYFETRVTVPAAGHLRISWRSGGRTLTSRAAAIAVR